MLSDFSPDNVLRYYSANCVSPYYYSTVFIGHFEYVLSKIALLHLKSDDAVPLFHALPI